MNRHALPLVFFLAVLSVVFLGATAVLAEGSAPAKSAPVPVKITLTPETQKSGKVNITATATTAAGAPIHDLKLTFTVVPDFFGKRPVFIGVNTTNDAGSALAGYAPTWNGPHHFQVSFEGNDAYAAAQATLDLDLKSLTAPYNTAPPALISLRKDVGRGALAVTAAVWALLIGVLVRVVAGIGRGRAAERSSTGRN